MRRHYNFELADDSVHITNPEKSRFAELDIDVCSTEVNANGIIFTKHSLQQAAHTLYLAPVLAKYNREKGDMEGHEHDEVGLGGFFNQAEIQVTEENGETHIKGVAYLWKQYDYVNDVLECLKARDGRAAVSMEIEILEYHPQETKTGKPAEPALGDIPDIVIDKFRFAGVTILGKDIDPAIPSAHLEVLSFAKLAEAWQRERQFTSLSRKGVNDQRYKNIYWDFLVPLDVRLNAEWALSFIKEHNLLIAANTFVTAKTLAEHQMVTPTQAKKFYRFWAHHLLLLYDDEEKMKKKGAVDKDGNIDEMFLTYLSYGGEAGRKWLTDLALKMEQEEKSFIVSYAIKIGSGKHYPLALDPKHPEDAPWDDSQVRRLAIEDPEFLTIAPKIFMKLLPGWRQGGVDKLKYPVASVVRGRWRYNKKAIASALGYATKEGDTQVKKKIENLFGTSEERKSDDKEKAQAKNEKDKKETMSNKEKGLAKADAEKPTEEQPEQPETPETPKPDDTKPQMAEQPEGEEPDGEQPNAEQPEGEQPNEKTPEELRKAEEQAEDEADKGQPTIKTENAEQGNSEPAEGEKPSEPLQEEMKNAEDEQGGQEKGEPAPETSAERTLAEGKDGDEMLEEHDISGTLPTAGLPDETTASVSEAIDDDISAASKFIEKCESMLQEMLAGGKDEEEKPTKNDLTINDEPDAERTKNEYGVRFKALLGEMKEIAYRMRDDVGELRKREAALEEYKEKMEQTAKMSKVNDILTNQIGDDLSASVKEKLRDEAKKYTLANLSAWENKVKALAYESVHKAHAKAKPSAGEKNIVKFANPWQGIESEKSDKKTIWEKL